MRMHSALRHVTAVAAFGLASLPVAAFAECGCRAMTHVSYQAHHEVERTYEAPAVVWHRPQAPVAYYNEPAPPYYPRRAHWRPRYHVHHIVHRPPHYWHPAHPPLSRYY